MALSIQNRILNQLVSDTARYFYMYEPIPILVTETDLTAKVLSVDLVVKNVDDNTVIETLTDYAVYDINPGQPINLDIIEIIQQRHNADIWKVGHINDIASQLKLVASEYAYDLVFNVDIGTSNSVTLSVVPIIGGRDFENFEPLVSNTFPLNDFQKFGIDISSRWGNYPIIDTSLTDPNSNLQKVSMTIQSNSGLKEPCGGMLYWKSRLGGWMQWGFDIKTTSKKVRHRGSIETGMFVARRNVINARPYIETDYTGVDYSGTVTLKSLSLTQDELRAVDSINESPICYYMSTPNGKLELMKMNAATVPINNLANGGDFQVSLGSISRTDFNTR